VAPERADEDSRVVIDLRTLIDKGDVSLNVPVTAGDIITVPPVSEAAIYVLGYVSRAGPIMLKGSQTITAFTALAMAGGASWQGRVEKSYIIRNKENGTKEVIDVDLSKVAHGIRPDVAMKAGDTLVIGAGMLMKMTEIFRPAFSYGGSATVGQ
jgi:protein involved in polysaccharide export with SLBB domain